MPGASFQSHVIYNLQLGGFHFFWQEQTGKQPTRGSNADQQMLLLIMYVHITRHLSWINSKRREDRSHTHRPVPIYSYFLVLVMIYKSCQTTHSKSFTTPSLIRIQAESKHGRSQKSENYMPACNANSKSCFIIVFPLPYTGYFVFLPRFSNRNICQAISQQRSQGRGILFCSVAR